jgi:hypothetical protein
MMDRHEYDPYSGVIVQKDKLSFPMDRVLG